MKHRVLVVEDDPEVTRLLTEILESGGYEPLAVSSAAELSNTFSRACPDVVLLDWRLPDANGEELLPRVRQEWPGTAVIVLTGHATLDLAVDAMRHGAFHFQAKPFGAETLMQQIQRACEYSRSPGSVACVAGRGSGGAWGSGRPGFRSPAMRAVLATVERVAPTDVPVLLTGESGTGKEVVADLVHALSRRSAGPCVKVNCAALPRELIESELFGATRGAYTGAHTDRDGLFRQAEGGSLFLDEIAEMPVDLQAKLLRALQERQVRPVGGRTGYPIDCRVIAATNQRIDDALEDGRLREDLYYRIGTIELELAPLRDRREDIVPLARMFLSRVAGQTGRTLAGLAADAVEALLNYDWPGNVRQLENVITRAALLAGGPWVTAADLVLRPGRLKTQLPADLSPLETAEREMIVRTLGQLQGNKLLTARRLGIGRQTLYNKLRRYSITT